MLAHQLLQKLPSDKILTFARQGLHNKITVNPLGHVVEGI